MSGRPLDGMRVVVTRPAERAGPLLDALAGAGAEPVPLPLIATRPIVDDVTDAALLAGLDADWIVVTSAAGAQALGARLSALRAAPSPGTRIAAVGAATEAALTAAGLSPHLVPGDATGVGLAAALAGRVEGLRVLLARARAGRPELPDRLAAAGALVTDLALYDTVAVEPDPASAARAVDADAWVFTSPSTVDAALAAMGRAALRRRLLVAIGPTTAAHLRAHGLPVGAVAGAPDAGAVVTALADAGRTAPPAV